MTRALFIGAAVLFALVILGLVGGLASQSPASLVLSLLCGSPLMMLALGLAVGRASNEFAVVRKDAPARAVVKNGVPIRRQQSEPLA